MPVLHLGVIDVPYGNPPKKSKVSKKKLKSSSALTTGDVASILEEKYHIQEIFFETKKKKIAAKLENGLAGALESLMMGTPPTLDPYGGATSKIEEMFRKFLEQGEMERLGYPGVPTAASGRTSRRQGGVNHRLLHPYAKDNPARPSFIDTGAFQQNFKAWID